MEEQLARLEGAIKAAEQRFWQVLGDATIPEGERSRRAVAARDRAFAEAAQLAETYLRQAVERVEREERNVLEIARVLEESLNPVRLQAQSERVVEVIRTAGHWLDVEALVDEAKATGSIYLWVALRDAGLPALQQRMETHGSPFRHQQRAVKGLAERIAAALAALEPDTVQEVHQARARQTEAVVQMVERLKTLAARHVAQFGGETPLARVLQKVVVTKGEGDAPGYRVTWQEPADDGA